MTDCPIIAPEEFDFEIIRRCPVAKPGRGHRRKKGISYLDIITAFDIETSRINIYGTNHSIMYIWQWQFGHECTVIGRTWEEFKQFYDDIAMNVPEDCRILVFDHNLEYEFQFLGAILDIKNEDIFATDLRKPLFFTHSRFEFRCSYRLSNYSLGAWTEIMGVDHQKLSGDDFNYEKIRYPWTQLSPEELLYCVNDVVGLVECIEAQLAKFGDNLYTLPYTSTGYIRRVVRKGMYALGFDYVQPQQNTLEVYDLLREAFRGGDTYANPSEIGSIVPDVYSYDRSSSYPDVMVHCKFPVSRFRDEDMLTMTRYLTCLKSGRACLVTVRIDNLVVKEGNTCPYISLSKCREVAVNRYVVNGRIVYADYIIATFTDIDLFIIMQDYQITNNDITFLRILSARYGYLPKPIREIVIDLYKDKTSLKGVKYSDPHQQSLAETRYFQSKALINCCYGMIVQRVISVPVIYNNGEWKYDPDYDRKADYEEKIKKTFLNYAWGVWVTAWARLRLWEGRQVCGFDDFLYCDTDSLKSNGDVDYTEYNAKRIKAAKESGAYAADKNGRIHYMGVFEKEAADADPDGPTYDLFRTWGPKRYAYTKLGKVKVTISGVNPDRASQILTELGGIEQFVRNMVFEHSGKIAVTFNDCTDFWTQIDGKPLHVISNMVLTDTEYKMKVSQNYRNFIGNLKQYLDFKAAKDYNKYSLLDYTGTEHHIT